MGVNAREVEGRSALRDITLENFMSAPANAIIDLGIVRARGRLRRAFIGQRSAGVGGTSVTVAIKRLRKGSAAVDLLKTNAIVTLASGDGSTVDTSNAPAPDAVATPAGCTKPVLSDTLGQLDLLPGDHLYAVVTHTGVYGTAPVVSACALVAPVL